MSCLDAVLLGLVEEELAEESSDEGVAGPVGVDDVRLVEFGDRVAGDDALADDDGGVGALGEDDGPRVEAGLMPASRNVCSRT